MMIHSARGGKSVSGKAAVAQSLLARRSRAGKASPGYASVSSLSSRGITAAPGLYLRSHLPATSNLVFPSLPNLPTGHSAGEKLTATCRAFSTLSSFAEPDPTLFSSSPSLTDTPVIMMNDETSGQLRADIRVMGSILGKIIREENPQVFQKVEHMRALAKLWRTERSDAVLAELADFVQTLEDKELFLISRAFTHFLALANAAEAHHRVRRLNLASLEEDGGAFYPKADSCGGAIPNLLKDFHTRDEVFKALTTQTTELVLTAHPTEVNRRTILNKKRRVQAILTKADVYRMVGASSFERKELDEALYREISSIWHSDEVARTKPTPETEAEKNTLVLETVLWEAVPAFLRKLDSTCREFLGERLPLEAAPIRFASWMGGDRDGNPNVKPDTTRIVCLKNRAKAAQLFGKAVQSLEGHLSTVTCSEELRAVVGKAREPYRAFLRPMVKKLQNTELWANQKIARIRHNNPGYSTESIEESDIYLSKKEFMEDLLLVRRSLVECGDSNAAEGLLTDIIRNVSAFGLTLIPLDVRQESDRHEEAIDCITRYLGLGSYSQWDEDTKINWLTSQIASKRPLLRKGVWYEHPDIFTETAIDTLEISQMIAEQHEDSLGAYVISQATHASDVLAVLLLQLDAGVKNPLRVAPLFETLDDLNGAVNTMRKLYSLPTYMGVIKGKQEIMIGYSDSAKDAGRLAASWAQFETQEALAELSREFSVDVTFFHGKGGTVGRGANPAVFEAIMAHPPKTINGKFRVTEQGEMINQNFGIATIAERTMDIYTAAVLSEKLAEKRSPSPEWRKMMKTISDVSCEVYRSVVRGDERFVPYFRSATPEQELASLNIGSRPAKRKATGGVESLRAIPWNFAWTQTRFNLPSWLGVAKAITEFTESDKADAFREMHKEFKSFRTTIDLVEMVLAKSEPAIASHYDSKLVKDPKAQELGNQLRQLHLETEKAVLDLSGHEKLGEDNMLLQRALNVRNPYVDCLNVLQAETLSRIRAHGEEEPDKVLKDALMTTITGVANGMGNTG